jgi:hypothetical protein
MTSRYYPADPPIRRNQELYLYKTLKYQSRVFSAVIHNQNSPYLTKFMAFMVLPPPTTLAVTITGARLFKAVRG